MATHTEVRVTVDQNLADQASTIYAEAGMTLSDSLRIMLLRTVADNALPFGLLIPNEETIDATMAVRRGEVVRVGSIDDLQADLHADE